MLRHMIAVTAAILALSTPTFAQETSEATAPEYQHCSEFPERLFSGDVESVIVARLQAFKDMNCSVSERYSQKRQEDVCDFSLVILKEIPDDPTQILIAQIFDC
ncbi:MAG: hypothetical protein VX730_06780 [Pseudomonadota bacterium]|nr:hypothetical protein [Pseudomonadota bacterium]